MTFKKNLLIIFAACAAMTATANAHPGSKILTTGSGNDRAGATVGVTYESIGGLHLFKGAQKIEGAAPIKKPVKHKMTQSHAAPCQCQYRIIRKMRTQGFYSGTASASQRFTQGFYSGQ